jgi:hypothetical protein
MTMSDRGIHPDLLEEEQSAQAAQEAPQPPPAPGRRNGRARAAEPSAPAPEPPPTAPEPAPPSPTEPESPESGETPTTSAQPEWWDQVKKAADAADPQAALATLLKNVPLEELEKHPVIQGWVGDMGAKRARAMLERQQQDAVERQKREAAASGDFYGLGQITAAEVQRQAAEQATAQTAAPFMDGVVAYQKTLPEDIQRKIQGQTFGAGKSYAEGVTEYLEAVHEAAVSHRLNEAVEQEIKRREPALRKAWLSESNGTQPVPELDGGRAASVREITGEQVERMSPDEYDTYFDTNGRPKPGVRYRLTERDIPVRQR